MSESKRKASAMSPDDGRAAKRQRNMNGEPDFESAERTSQMGLQFLNGLKQAKDKTGRLIATDFLFLPDPTEVPEYYDEIQLPIALDSIEGKLQGQDYPNIAALEGDVKRMVANAKQFNVKGSTIYEDAERIRKTASNWMVKNNPAYRDPGYSAQPTPIPGELNGAVRSGAGSAFGTPTPQVARGGPVRLNITHKAKSATPAPPPKKEAPEERTDFVGKSFGEAQDLLMQEMIDYAPDAESVKIFDVFKTLPPRSLADYYEVIKKPVSLKSIQKRAKGIHGRNEPTGVSDFTSWVAFEEEVGLIWQNAREYNEDYSDMWNLAGEFETLFKKRLADAKAVVEEPHPPKVKLKMAPPIKLRLNASKESPGPQSARATPDSRGTPGVIVDQSALERQKAHVSAGVNGAGQRPPSSGAAPTPGVRNPFSGSRSGSAATIPPLSHMASDGARSAPAGSPVLTNGVKTESQPGSAAMPPPALAQRLPSGSPHPQAALQQPPPSLVQSLSQFSQSYYSPAPTTPTGLESKSRSPGKGAKDALLPQLVLQSHPQLNLPKPVVVTIPASNRLTHQSLTITLPAAHTHLQITPTIPVANTNRPYRIFVTVNGNRTAEVVRPGGGGDRTKPLFEGNLRRDGPNGPIWVHRIEVEVLAAKEGGTRSTIVNGKEGKESVDWEKCTVFVHLLK